MREENAQPCTHSQWTSVQLGPTNCNITPFILSNRTVPVWPCFFILPLVFSLSAFNTISTLLDVLRLHLSEHALCIITLCFSFFFFSGSVEGYLHPSFSTVILSSSFSIFSGHHLLFMSPHLIPIAFRHGQTHTVCACKREWVRACDAWQHLGGMIWDSTQVLDTVQYFDWP